MGPFPLVGLTHTCTSTRKGYVYTNVGRVAPFLVLVHVNCRGFNIFSSHGLLPSDLVGQSVERRRSNPKVVGSIPTLVRVFLCPCVGPVPSVGLTLTWFIWDRNLALHVTLQSLQLTHTWFTWVQNSTSHHPLIVLQLYRVFSHDVTAAMLEE